MRAGFALEQRARLVAVDGRGIRSAGKSARHGSGPTDLFEGFVRFLIGKPSNPS